MHIQSPGIVRALFNLFQGYLGIFRDIDAYCSTLTCAQLAGREEASPALLKIEKNVLILERKVLIMSIFGLNFPFKI